MRPISKPDDWDEPITYRGFSRSNLGQRYDVRLTLGGKQTHIASCYSQVEAAKAYDMALWLFGPKMGRRLQPNFPDEFGFINRDMIARELPRLLKVYDVMPFRHSDDESVDEDALRDRLLKGTFERTPTHGLADYNQFVDSLKRLRMLIENENIKLHKRKSALPLIHKLGVIPSRFEAVVLQLAATIDQTQELEKLLETNRSYYQKIAHNPEQSL